MTSGTTPPRSPRTARTPRIRLTSCRGVTVDLQQHADEGREVNATVVAQPELTAPVREVWTQSPLVPRRPRSTPKHRRPCATAVVNVDEGGTPQSHGFSWSLSPRRIRKATPAQSVTLACRTNPESDKPATEKAPLAPTEGGRKRRVSARGRRFIQHVIGLSSACSQDPCFEKADSQEVRTEVVASPGPLPVPPPTPSTPADLLTDPGSLPVVRMRSSSSITSSSIATSLVSPTSSRSPTSYPAGARGVSRKEGLSALQAKLYLDIYAVNARKSSTKGCRPEMQSTRGGAKGLHNEICNKIIDDGVKSPRQNRQW